MPFPSTAAPLAHALAARGYDDPTPVQAAILQTMALGRDLLVSAQTGSGKTVAFGLAMAEDLLGEAEVLPPAAAPLAMVIAPTRELAQQVQAELDWLYAEAQGKVLACVGGMDPRREQRLLMGGAHIVAGTPGRLRDHITRKHLDVSALRVAVLDEADEMLDLGFREDLEFILEATPAGRRTLLFSATIPPPIAALAQRFQRNAARIEAGGGRQPHADIAYTALNVASGETIPAMINVLRFYEAPLAIVFCPTRDSVRTVWAALTTRGFLAVPLSGEMGQADRNQALLSLRTGRARVCIATDVAARGLDLPDLSLVIHAELPMNAALLLHRSGRTGRAGRKGVSVLLVNPSRRRRAEAMLREAGVTAEWAAAPDAEAVRQRDHIRLLTDPILTKAPDDSEREAAARLLADHDAETLAVALLRSRRGALPEEETVTHIAPMPQTASRAPGRAPPGERRNPQSRGEKPKHGSLADPIWLSANIGRRNKADLKWLLPLLCRAGGVTREEIGAICILGEETRFEVAGSVASAFLQNSASGAQDVCIARAQPPPERRGGVSKPAGRPGGKPAAKQHPRKAGLCR